MIIALDYGRLYLSTYNPIILTLRDIYNRDPQFKEICDTNNSLIMFLKSHVQLVSDFNEMAKSMTNKVDELIDQIKDTYNTERKRSEDSCSVFREAAEGIEAATNITTDVVNTAPPIISGGQAAYDMFHTALNMMRDTNANPDEVAEYINNLPATQRFAIGVTKAFDVIGNFISNGISSIGNIMGSLVAKLSIAADNIAYCTDVIKNNNNGFEAFMNDPQCINIVMSALAYCGLFYLIFKTIKILAKKLASILYFFS